MSSCALNRNPTDTPIHRGIQNLANGNVGASDLQQAQPLELRILAKERGIALLHEEQGMCKHILDEVKRMTVSELAGRIVPAL